MSDCSGIKTYLRSTEFEMSKYIDLTEKSEEERILEFVRTIELAVDSYDREKYGLNIFIDIVNVACNNVSDIFGGSGYDDCVITSPYAVSNEEEDYLTFVRDLKSDLKKYKEGVISVKTFYNYAKQGCNSLIFSAEHNQYQKIKSKNN